MHERFFEQLVEQIPNLGKANIKIVTDQKVGITNALQKVFPNDNSGQSGTSDALGGLWPGDGPM